VEHAGIPALAIVQVPCGGHRGMSSNGPLKASSLPQTAPKAFATGNAPMYGRGMAFGEIPGNPPGTTYNSYEEMVEAGIHRCSAKAWACWLISNQRR
jgi:hypothetical protein